MGLSAPSEDRTCLVTGASAGIGTAMARELARKGHGVTLVARREERLHDLATELHKTHGVRAEVVPADLTDLEARRALVAEVADRGLAVDLLANNAGIGTYGPVAETDADREVSMLRTNVEALAHLCSLVVPDMVARRSGAILNVASTAAFQPLPGQAGYGASKAFVVSYTHALRAELRGSGVSVSMVCPGPVETEFARAAGAGDGAGDGTATNAPLPDFMWRPATEVARQAVEAVVKERAVVVPGVPNRLVAEVARHSPPRLLARVVAKRHPAMR